jgi:putative transposase
MAEEHEKRKAYPSDLTAAQWAILEPLLPAPRHRGGGRPRELARREGLNPLWYLNRSGGHWERLPQDLLPQSRG